MFETGPPDTGDADEAVGAFNRCHEGILRQLSALGELPMLLDTMRQTRRLAGDAIGFFRNTVRQHHRDEERQLFPVVLRSALDGQEREQVRAAIERLTREHREVEAAWAALEPGMEALVQGRDAELPLGPLNALLAAYTAHARYEESAFLPLARSILDRHGADAGALGMTIHRRIGQREGPEPPDPSA